MSNTEGGIDPFEVVARVLGCPPAAITTESAMKRTHKWDSLGHVSVVTALEEAYGVSISDDEMLALTTMKSILEFHKRQTRTDGDGA
jgi:citrate synthase